MTSLISAHKLVQLRSMTSDTNTSNFYNCNDFLDDKNISWMKELTAHPQINSNFNQLSENHQALTEQLGKLSDGLTYTSDSDYPLVPFHFSLKESNLPQEVTQNLTPDKFLELVQTVDPAKNVLETNSATVQELNVPEFKTYLDETQNISDEQDILKLIDQIVELGQKQSLSVKVFKISYDCYSTYWITLINPDHLVGLMTVGIYT